MIMQSLAVAEEKAYPPIPDKELVNVLVVDDEESIQRLMGRILCSDGVSSCTMVSTATEARQLMMQQDFQLALCDVNLLTESGLDLAQHIAVEHPDTAVLMVSGIDDGAISEKALEIGAYGYIIKPFTPQELKINVSNALRRRKLEIQNRCRQQGLERKILDGTQNLRDSLLKIEKSMDEFIQAIGMMVETRDPYTAGHQQRVAVIARAIAEALGLPANDVEGIFVAGLIHDIGKISVPAEILSNPSRLTEHESNIIKSHSQAGFAKS